LATPINVASWAALINSSFLSDAGSSRRSFFCRGDVGDGCVTAVSAVACCVAAISLVAIFVSSNFQISRRNINVAPGDLFMPNKFTLHLFSAQIFSFASARRNSANFVEE